MSSPGWSDEELLRELRAALLETPVDDKVVQAAQAAFTWRTVEMDLELLGLAADSGLADGELVRGAPDEPRTLSFHGKGLGVEIEIDEAGIVGQLAPPQPGEVVLMTPAGPEASTQADEVGCFEFALPASGPVRLECRIGADRFVTEWVTV